jgi:hypothetical protein
MHSKPLAAWMPIRMRTICKIFGNLGSHFPWFFDGGEKGQPVYAKGQTIGKCISGMFCRQLVVVKGDAQSAPRAQEQH